MKKTKIILLVLVVALALTAFCACGKGAKSIEDVKGETIDAGNIKALCPTGWLNDPVSDYSSDEDDAIDPDTVRFIKGAKSSLGILTKPYVQIGYAESGWTVYTDWYDDVEEVSVEIAGKKYTGFTFDSIGTKEAMLYNEDKTIQIIIVRIDEVSYDDIEVQAIIASIEH